MKPEILDSLRKQIGDDKVHTSDEVLDARRFDYSVPANLRYWRGE
jgi:hypothetical protein